MPVSLGSPSLFTNKTVSTAEIAAAVADVKAAGVVEATIRPLVDAFASANSEGRVSATSRKAFEAALLGLVQALPRTPSSVLMRRDEASLTSGIQQAQTVIGKQTTRIAGLEAEVQTLTTSLTTKKAEADGLLQTQTTLQTTLSNAKQKQKNDLGWSIVLAFAGVVNNASGVTAVATVNGIDKVLNIGEIESELKTLEGQIANTHRTSWQLQQRLDVVTSTVAAQRQSLDGLQLLETSLRAQASSLPAPSSTSTLSERLNGLAFSLEVHQALSSNLGKQIDVLETMKAGLTTTNVELDALITVLKADNDGLRAEITNVERAIKANLIDMALSTSSLPKSFKVGALELSTKTLLLDGVEGLRLSVLAQAHALSQDLIANTAIGASSSSPMGRLFLAALNDDVDGVHGAAAAVVADNFSGASSRMVLALLNNDPTGVRKAALDGVLDSVDTLTSTQRNLIEQLLFAPRTAAAPIDSDMVLQAVTRIAADPGLDEPRARAIAHAITTTDAAMVVKADDPILNHLEYAADVRIAQATSTTTYLSLWDATDAHLGRLAHLPLETLSFAGNATFSAAGLQTLSTLPTLTTLHWKLQRMSSAEVEAVAGLASLRKLELDITPADIATLATLPALTSLDLHMSTKHTDASLAGLSTLPALTALTAAYSGLTGTGIAASGLCDRLTTLSIQGTTQSAADLAALATMPNLEVLRYPYPVCTEADLLQLASSTSLREVYIGNTAGFDRAKLNAAAGRTLFV